MRPQDNAVLWINKSVGDICRAASSVPEEKHDWEPLGARSVLSQMQEVAASHEWFVEVINTQKVPPVRFQDPTVQAHFKTVADCIDAALKGSAQMAQTVYDIPNEILEIEVVLPIGSGGMMRILDVIWMYNWNLIYHLGQINYIQTMLGDAEMH